MIKTIVTLVVTAVAGLVGYLASDSFRERLAQKQRDKIASEVTRGNEAAVNGFVNDPANQAAGNLDMAG